jgi:hypothetical protein
MKRLAILTSLLGLPACVTAPRLAAPTEHFSLIEDITPEIKRAQALIKDASDRFGVVPYPEFRVVRPGHPMLQNVRIARAVVFEGGKEALYISRDALSRPGTLSVTIDHEIAHFAAWRQFGYEIREHGTEWRAVCMVNAGREACRAV